MDIWILISLIIGIIAVIIGFIVYYLIRKKKEEDKVTEPDYKVFYSIGFIWIPVGVVFMIAVNRALGLVFIALGIAYMTIGLANKDKWKKKKDEKNG
jgi:hypothetical protein